MLHAASDDYHLIICFAVNGSYICIYISIRGIGIVVKVIDSKLTILESMSYDANL